MRRWITQLQTDGQVCIQPRRAAFWLTSPTEDEVKIFTMAHAHPRCRLQCASYDHFRITRWCSSIKGNDLDYQCASKANSVVMVVMVKWWPSYCRPWWEGGCVFSWLGKSRLGVALVTRKSLTMWSLSKVRPLRSHVSVVTRGKMTQEAKFQDQNSDKRTDVSCTWQLPRFWIWHHPE